MSISSIKSQLKQPVVAILILLFLVLLTYLGVMNAEFVSDDKDSILNNAVIGDASRIFDNPLYFIRPLTNYVSYSVGGFTPAYFRIYNIIFHFGVVVMVYLLLGRLYKKSWYALFAAAIYAVHPVLVEAVTWISAYSYTQYTFYVLASLYTYILGKKRKPFYYLSLALFVLAMLTTEKSLILPGVIFLYEFSLGSVKKTWRRIIPYFGILIPFGIMAYINLGSRVTVLQTENYVMSGVHNPLLQIPISLSTYFHLIFWPTNLVFYHMDGVGISYVSLGIRWVVTLVFFALLGLAYRKDKYVFFCLSLFLLSLAPVLTPLKIAWVVAERYAYLGTIGIIAATVYLLFRVTEKRHQYRTVLYVFLSVVVVLLMMRSFERNQDWQTEENLWIHTVQASPKSPNAHNNMGYVYDSWGDQQNAVAEYKAAIELSPHYAAAYHNMGVSYMKMKDYNRAVESFSAAVELNPRIWQSQANLAVLYWAAGEKEAAREHAKIAIQYGVSASQFKHILDSQ